MYLVHSGNIPSRVDSILLFNSKKNNNNKNNNCQCNLQHKCLRLSLFFAVHAFHSVDARICQSISSNVWPIFHHMPLLKHGVSPHMHKHQTVGDVWHILSDHMKFNYYCLFIFIVFCVLFNDSTERTATTTKKNGKRNRIHKNKNK